MRSHGYSARGQKANIYRRRLAWGPRITAISVISTEGILDVRIYRGHINAERFLYFVNETLIPCLQPFDGVNSRSVVILGNNLCSFDISLYT